VPRRREQIQVVIYQNLNSIRQFVEQQAKPWLVMQD